MHAHCAALITLGQFRHKTVLAGKSALNLQKLPITQGEIFHFSLLHHGERIYAMGIDLTYLLVQDFFGSVDACQTTRGECKALINTAIGYIRLFFRV